METTHSVVARKAKGPGRGKGYGKHHLKGRHKAALLMPVDAYMGFMSVATPAKEKRPWHRRSHSRFYAACRLSPSRFVDTSPYADTFLRMCQTHKLPLNDDLACPKGHSCDRWDVVHGLTGKTWLEGSVEIAVPGTPEISVAEIVGKVYS